MVLRRLLTISRTLSHPTRLSKSLSAVLSESSAGTSKSAGVSCLAPPEAATPPPSAAPLAFDTVAQLPAPLDNAAIAKEDLEAGQLISHASTTIRLSARVLEGHRFAGYLLVLGPLGGPQQSVPQMVELMPFPRADDLRNHLARLTMVPQALRNERALLEEGLRRGITPPKAILAGVPSQFDAVIAGKLQALREPFERIYPDLSPEQAAQLKEQGNVAVDAVLAEFALLRDFVRDTYVPKARESIACIELPQGREWYAFALRNQTTTDLAPQAIHDIGLSEVKRIRAEMLQVIRRTDWFAADPARASLPASRASAAPTCAPTAPGACSIPPMPARTRSTRSARWWCVTWTRPSAWCSGAPATAWPSCRAAAAPA
jgi:hypothetical protein